MICPNCNKEIAIEPYVYINVENYGTTQIAVSKCCGTPYRISRKISFNLSLYTGDKTVDDWGTPIINKPIKKDE